MNGGKQSLNPPALRAAPKYTVYFSCITLGLSKINLCGKTHQESSRAQKERGNWVPALNQSWVSHCLLLVLGLCSMGYYEFMLLLSSPVQLDIVFLCRTGSCYRTVWESHLHRSQQTTEKLSIITHWGELICSSSAQVCVCSKVFTSEN